MRPARCHQQPLAVGACAALACTLYAAPGRALEWRATPAVTVGAADDSNIRLSPFDERRVSNGTVTATADLTARDAGLQFRARPEVRAVRYADDGETDRNDTFMTFDLALDGEHRRWSFGGAYRRESTLTSEFEDTGLLGVDDERVERSLSTSWYRAGPRGGMSFAASAADINYSGRLASPFVDYRYGVLQGGYSRPVSRRSAWQLRASHSYVDGAVRDSSSTSLQVSWSHAFSTALDAEFGVGALAIATGGPSVQETSSASFSFAVTRDWLRWSVRASGVRDVQPDGRGTLLREDRVTLEAERRFGSRLSARASLRGTRFAAAGFGLLDELFDRDYAQAEMAVSWRVAERWDLFAAVQRRAQTSLLVPRADGLGSSVAVTYRGR